MFSCKSCAKSFSRKDNLKRHISNVNCATNILCDDCGSTFANSLDWNKHKNTLHKRARLNQPSISAAIFCDACDMHLENRTAYNGHLRSLQHKSKVCVRLDDMDGVELIQSAFESRINNYRISSTISNPIDVNEYLNSVILRVHPLLERSLEQHGQIKFNFELFGNYFLSITNEEEIKSFNTRNECLLVGSDMEKICLDLKADIEEKTSEFQEKNSGWALERLLYLEVNISKYNPLRGSQYIPLPKEIANRKAVINFQNSDDECFKYCILAALHPVQDNPHRIGRYLEFKDELDFTNIEFPVKLCDISKFEQLNKISVNVYGLEKTFDNNVSKIEIVGPLHLSKFHQLRHINLLLISNDNGDNHYCLIKSMSRLLSKQICNRNGEINLCDGCLSCFSNPHHLERHKLNDCNGIYTKLPSTDIRTDKYGNKCPENILKFENIERKLKVPFVIYADFEAALKPLELCEPNSDNSYSMNTFEHEPYSFAYYVKCSYNDKLSKFETYRGIDCAKVFIEKLESDAKDIYTNYLKTIIAMKPLTPDQKIDFSTSNACHICDKIFKDNQERVRDHCHLTGDYRGAAHKICNLNFKIPNFIPVYFHNLSGYDSHLFIKSLAHNEENITVIAQNKEKYISFSKRLLVDTYQDKITHKMRNIYLNLRFLDSFKFMASSLDQLAKNLNDNQCCEVWKYFPCEEKFNLLRQKGVFPYSYVSDIKKLDEIKLPSQNHFYNNLKKEHISLEDYERAHQVWNLFGCKTLGEYSDLYLKSDVLILADIFENFRNVCLSTYGLEPAQYYTAPGFSWDAMLKYTNIELELITDIDMLHFLKKGIRGGVSQCSVRKAEANNQFIQNFDPSKPTSFITYLDATNLYGAAMSQSLPKNKFRWLDKIEIIRLNIENLSDDSDTGYILEVDLQYPTNLHDLHDDLPFCPESIVSPISKLKLKKLIPNLFDKTKYIIHYQNLKQALRYGLKLTRVYRVLSFEQSAWLKPYIDLNTLKRNQCSSKFEKDYYKLLNNSIYGKTMENVDKRVDVKLISHWKNMGHKVGAGALIARPHYKNCSIFTDNFVAIQMEKVKVVYNKPIYLGFSILDLSKIIIYDFYYGFIKQKYGENASLLYTDTDSLILLIFTNNFYDDMRLHLDKFDTSNFSLNNIHGIPVNSSILGKMKDEYSGKIIWEFYGTGAKAYCVNAEGDLTKKAKGISKCVVEKDLHLNDYKNVVEREDAVIYKKMTSFQSRLHKMYSTLKNKVALSHHDDKRFILSGSDKTLAWGHTSIKM